MKTYAALHCHSTYSFQDGVGNIQQWVQGAKAKGLAGLAITDHGDNSSIAELHYWGKKEEYPVIFGCELYVTDDITENRSDNRYRHLIVWVKDEIGYRNLCRLHKLAWSPDHFYYKPRITLNELFKHKDGLVVGSACIAGVVAADIIDAAETKNTIALINKGLVDPSGHDIKSMESRAAMLVRAATERIGLFKHHFGDDFYLEMQYNNQCHDWNHKTHEFDPLPNGLDRQRVINRHYLKLAQDVGVKLVASPDAHMINCTDKKVQDCQMGTRYMSSSRTGDGDREVLGWHFKETYYLPNYVEMKHHYAHNFDFISDEVSDIILSNTLGVLDKCKNVNFKNKIYLPNVEVVGAKNGVHKILLEIKKLGIYTEDLRSNPAYKERLLYELKILCANGTIDLADYFLLLSDVVLWAKKNNVMVGPGRGSAGGCLVAFLLGITKLDPIKWNLSFERFLNMARVKMGTLPDVDIDFADPQKIFAYLKSKWGEDYVCGISANQTFKFKLALKDAYRGLTGNSVGPGLEEITKLIGEDESDAILSGWFDSPQVKNWIAKGDTADGGFPVDPQDRREIIEVAKQLRGQMRHRGVHAAAVVVASEPIHEIVPVARITKAKDESGGKWVTQYTMKWVEAAGLVKFDILGLNTLNDISMCLNLIKQHRGIDIDPYDLDWDDEEVYANFTPDGVTSVFQFDTEVARPFLNKLKPRSIVDLSNITALARPGAMDSKQDVEFINRWVSKEKLIYPHPSLEPILKDTLGIIIYQEQVMAAVQILGGFTAEEADDIRRGMGKKRADLIDAAKSRFVEYAVQHYDDIDLNRANELWDLIDSFARYGFNRSHSIAYAMLAYICQYLKTKYPREWWCAVLQSEDDESRFKRIMAHVKTLKDVKVLPPDINDSQDKYVINKDGNIVTPLNYIKKIGETVLKNIIHNRFDGYKSLEDFCGRRYTVQTAGKNKTMEKSIADKNAALQLIWAGCFDSLHVGETRKQLIGRYFDYRIQNGKETKKTKETLRLEYETNYANLNRFGEILMTAKAMPILSVDFHEIVSDVLKEKKSNLFAFKTILAASNSSYVRTAGLVTDVQYIKTKKGEDAAFVEFQNDGDMLRLVLWPETFKKNFKYIKQHALLKIEGKVNIWNQKHSVVVNTVELIDCGT